MGDGRFKVRNTPLIWEGSIKSEIPNILRVFRAKMKQLALRACRVIAPRLTNWWNELIYWIRTKNCLFPRMWWALFCSEMIWLSRNWTKSRQTIRMNMTSWWWSWWNPKRKGLESNATGSSSENSWRWPRNRCMKKSSWNRRSGQCQTRNRSTCLTRMSFGTMLRGIRESRPSYWRNFIRMKP